MFNAPQIITQIPDIAQLYEINEAQCEALDDAVQELDDDLFLSDMHEGFVERWEGILKITPNATDTLDERRFRVKTTMMDKLPYTIRVLDGKLSELCPGGYEITLNSNKTHLNIAIAIRSQSSINDVVELVEKMLPLNMTYEVSELFSRYGALTSYTHQQLSAYTHQEIREDVTL